MTMMTTCILHVICDVMTVIYCQCGASQAAKHWHQSCAHNNQNQVFSFPSVVSGHVTVMLLSYLQIFDIK